MPTDISSGSFKLIMVTGPFSRIKSKIVNYKESQRQSRPSRLPPIIILILAVLALVLFDYTNHAVFSPENELSTKMKAENPAKQLVTVNDNNIQKPTDLFNYQLNMVIKSAKKIPFKASVTTEQGLKGYWFQSGDNCRFEDSSRINIIIINSSQMKLWVINSERKTALETQLDTSTVNYYLGLSPVLLIEGLSGTPIANTKSLEEILPSGSNLKLTFTKEGLPKRWESSDGKTKRYIEWFYIQLGNIPRKEFELPEGINILKQ
ncbi:MAG: hypothetical protein QME63_05865 [Actinomycetota bacterium]|nr:hypothetical protein [Actinomycetota bacterium]